MKLLIVDDHVVFLQGLVEIFRRALPVEEIYTASTAASALRKLDTRQNISAAVVDLSLPDASGTQLIKQIRHRHPLVGILVLSAKDDEATMCSCLNAGALGFVSKSNDSATILEALETVLSGSIYPKIDLHFLDNNSQKTKHRREKNLTPRQQEIMEKVFYGYSNKQIAEDLRIRENTVKTHLASIYRNLGVENRLACIQRLKEMEDY